uniref:ORF2 n=1 Tax=Taro bacilliform CH virus TaxID=1634914 RepID=A0A384ZCK2_9VIRU|nr:ORF2 [Taro bacilliform CH virus]
MSHINTQATESYTTALQATEEIEAPAVGFAKPADNKGPNSGTTTLIKQNNTQIELLVRLTEEVKALRQEVAQLRKEKSQASSIPDDLSSGLKNLKLSDQKTREAPGKLRVFKDPLEEYKKEKARKP